MKYLFCLLIVCALILGMCACGEKNTDESTVATTPVATTTAASSSCVHQYADADCTTPKTCTLCGATRGDALGHDYTENTCARCGYEDKTYVSLTQGTWQLDSLSENDINLSCISMTFDENGNAEMLIRIYINMDRLPDEQRENYPDEYLYDYSGTIYAFTGSYTKLDLKYTVNGNEITCSALSGAQTSATFTLERVAGNQLRLIFFEGNTNAIYWQIGDILCSYND